MHKKNQNEISLKLIQELATSLYFQLSPEQCSNWQLELQSTINEITTQFNKINTDNVLVLDYPLPFKQKNYLRPDTDEVSLPTKAVLACAPTILDHYITINKVKTDED